jgi:predicted O-methyltransferase YrrM
MFPHLHRLPAKLIRRMIRPYRAIGGFLTEGEAVALFRYANRLPARATAVEIGSWKGKSTFCIARGLHGGGRLHAIDPFDAAGEPGSAEIYARERSERPLREQFEANTAPFARDIAIHQAYSREVATAFPSIDFLLIDGDHSIEGAKYDFDTFAPCIVSGGYVAFHDYYAHRPELGPTWVVENIVKPGGRFTPCELADSLWIGRKI